MTISKRLKVMLRALLLKAGRLVTDKGELIFDGEQAEIGTEVFQEVENADGEIEVRPAESGEYRVDSKVYVVSDGVITDIKDEGEPEPEPEPEPTPDPAPDPDAPVETAEEEPQADPADEREEQEEERSVEDRVADLEARMGQVLEAVEVIINSFSEVESRLASLEEKIAKLDAEPAGEPAEQREDMSEVPEGRLGYVKALMKK